tara:strand:- start:28 stop:414 length:387 start_codon:yes stop_codon:yes gene_type:complete
MAVQQQSKKQAEKEQKIADYNEYVDQRDKFTDAMTDKLRHDRYPYNMSEKDLMKLLAYADEDKVFGSKVKAGEIRKFLNDRAKDKVLSRPEFKKALKKKDGGLVRKKKSKVAGRLALRGYGKAMKGKK